MLLCKGALGKTVMVVVTGNDAPGEGGSLVVFINAGDGAKYEASGPHSCKTETWRPTTGQADADSAAGLRLSLALALAAQLVSPPL